MSLSPAMGQTSGNMTGLRESGVETETRFELMNDYIKYEVHNLPANSALGIIGCKIKRKRPKKIETPSTKMLISTLQLNQALLHRARRLRSRGLVLRLALRICSRLASGQWWIYR